MCPNKFVKRGGWQMVVRPAQANSNSERRETWGAAFKSNPCPPSHASFAICICSTHYTQFGHPMQILTI